MIVVLKTATPHTIALENKTTQNIDYTGFFFVQSHTDTSLSFKFDIKQRQKNSSILWIPEAKNLPSKYQLYG